MIGGSLKDNFNEVSALKTFPATPVGGKPSHPVMVKVGFHI